MNFVKQWYAVYVRTNQEKKVCQQFRKHGVVHFIPAEGESKKLISGHRNTSIFPNVLFVFIQENEIEKVRQVSGVVNLLYWLRQPAVFPASVVETIRDFQLTYQITGKETIAVQGNRDNGHLHLPLTECREGNGEAILRLPFLGFILTGKKKERETGTSLKFLSEAKENKLAV